MQSHFRTVAVALIVTVVAAMTAPSSVAQGFGGSLAISGDNLFISETTQTSQMGTVYVYSRNAQGEWVEVDRLNASDGAVDDRFGRAMDADSRTLVVGATKWNNDLGAGYVFEKNASGDWVEQAMLNPAESTESQNFGRAIAVDGNFILMSAAGYDGGKGAVFAFKRDGSGNWNYHSMLQAPSPEPNSLYGLSLDMDDGRALVGAQLLNQNTGGVFAYTYNSSTDTWESNGAVEINGPVQGSQVGLAIEIEGERAMVSAPGLGNGSVFLLSPDEETGSWSVDRLINPWDGDAGFFGSSLAFMGADLWIGAQFAYGGVGTIYRYELGEDGSITSVDRFTPDGFGPGTLFAGGLAVSNDFFAVGALGIDSGLGAAFAYEEEMGAWTQQARFESEVTGMDAITGNEIRCDEGAADAFDCEGVDMLSFLPIADIGGGRGTRMNDVWGWTDASTGREYAIVGRVDGTAFIDITDPVNPHYLGDLPKTEGSPSSSWRDMKVYMNHVYIVADNAGNHGMQIFDLTQLRDVPNAPVIFEETAHYDGIASAHNIVINESTGFAYTVGNGGGGETCGGGSHMIDLSNPTEPVFAGCFGHEGTGNAGTGYSHDSMCITYAGPDAEYVGREICFGSNETALSIADVTDKSNPTPISKAEYPNVGYTHQGWITDDHQYFYMNDETDETGGLAERTRTLVWDVSDLDDPVLLKEHMGTTAASDHNLYIKGNLMYQSNYNAGLRILDISDPENPVEVAHFDTHMSTDNVAGFNGSWSNYPYFESGTIVVTSIGEGVFFVKKREIDI